MLLARLREDVRSADLLETTIKDAELGRLSHPRPIGELVSGEVLLHPRFGVAQVRSDGTTKVRAVDHFSWSGSPDGRGSSVNGQTAPAEKLSHDTLDGLGTALRSFVDLVGEIPGLMKADVDSAFRRIPVRADQRWACGIVFAVGWQVTFRFVCVSVGATLPFAL